MASKHALPHFVRFTRAIALVSGCATVVACSGTGLTDRCAGRSSETCHEGWEVGPPAMPYDGAVVGTPPSTYDGSTAGPPPYEGVDAGTIAYDGSPLGPPVYDGG